MTQTNSSSVPLLPFSGEPSCPKCTRRKIKVEYCYAPNALQWGRKCPPQLIGKEHLHCRCSVCGFTWITSCADHVEPSVVEPTEPSGPKLRLVTDPEAKVFQEQLDVREEPHHHLTDAAAHACQGCDE